MKGMVSAIPVSLRFCE